MGKAAAKTAPQSDAVPAHKGNRTLVKRNVAPVAGASNIVVVKAGEDLLKSLLPRYQAMQTDLPRMEFYWSKIMVDSSYYDSKEFPADQRMAQKWGLAEGVDTIIGYRKKMNRIKVWIDHFKMGHDYELTVDEIVEILS